MVNDPKLRKAVWPKSCQTGTLLQQSNPPLPVIPAARSALDLAQPPTTHRLHPRILSRLLLLFPADTLGHICMHQRCKIRTQPPIPAASDSASFSYAPVPSEYATLHTQRSCTQTERHISAFQQNRASASAICLHPRTHIRSTSPSRSARSARASTRKSKNKHKLVASIALQSQHDQICGTPGSLTITKKHMSLYTKLV